MAPQCDGPIVLFDGVCNLCNASVNSIIRNDPRSIFRFAPLQGRSAQELITELTIPTQGAGSIILIEKDNFYLRSDAVLRIARRMRWPWNWFWLFIAIPRPLRDSVYNWVARNRYKWFGKQETCMVPTEDIMARFIE